MAKLKVLACCMALVFTFFLLIDIVVLGIVIGIGARGIDKANDANTCELNVNTSVECVIATPISPATMNATMPTTGRIKGAEKEYLYWMAGATGCGVLWAFLNTLTLIALSELIRAVFAIEENNRKKRKDEKDGDDQIEMKNLTASRSPEPTGADQTDTGPDKIKLMEDTIGSYQIHEWARERLRHFNCSAFFGLFFSSLFFMCAFLCLLWGIAISYDHARTVSKTVNAFIIVELLVAVVLPICLFIGFAFFAVVIDYVSVGHLDFRIFIPRFVRDVKFEQGVKQNYWVIDDVIYYPLKKKEERSKHGCFYSIDTSPATWFLTVIVCTGFHIAISVFVDMTLDKQVTVDSCSNDLIDRTFDCFNASTLNFVDCVENKNTNLLHCFKFYRFGVETDFVGSVSTAYFAFLFTMAVFSHVYFVVRTLLRIKPSRFWGIMFLLAGIICYIGSIIITIIWINGYVSDTASELVHINVINITQFFMVSTYVGTVGLFLLVGKWYERVETKVHENPIKIPLVSYKDTERKYIYEVEARESWPGHDATSPGHDTTPAHRSTAI